jgi:hypothetical protein
MNVAIETITLAAIIMNVVILNVVAPITSFCTVILCCRDLLPQNLYKICPEIYHKRPSFLNELEEL